MGKKGTQGCLLAVKNLDTNYKPINNVKIGMYEDSYTIREQLPEGIYKVALAAIDVYGNQYWSREYIYFYVNSATGAENDTFSEVGECLQNVFEASDFNEVVVTPEEPEIGEETTVVEVVSDIIIDSTESIGGVSVQDVFTLSPDGISTSYTNQIGDVYTGEEEAVTVDPWYMGFINWILGDEDDEKQQVQEVVPGDFEIISPKNNKIYKLGKNVTVKWEESNGADYYVVYLVNEDTGENIIDDTTSAKYTFKGKELEIGNYSVFVEAFNFYGITECESLQFSVTHNGKSVVEIASSEGKVMEGGTVPSDSPLTITLSSDVSSYSIELVSETLGKTLYSRKNCTDKKRVIPSEYLYSGNDYALTVVAQRGNNGIMLNTNRFLFNVALDYSYIGPEGKFQAPITKDSNYIITVNNKNGYFGQERVLYVKTLASNIEYLIFRAGDNFTEEQVMCLRDIISTVVGWIER